MNPHSLTLLLIGLSAPLPQSILASCTRDANDHVLWLLGQVRNGFCKLLELCNSKLLLCRPSHCLPMLQQQCCTNTTLSPHHHSLSSAVMRVSSRSAEAPTCCAFAIKDTALTPAMGAHANLTTACLCPAAESVQRGAGDSRGGPRCAPRHLREGKLMLRCHCALPLCLCATVRCLACSACPFRVGREAVGGSSPLAACTCPSLMPKGVVSWVLHAYLLRTPEGTDGVITNVRRAGVTGWT